MSSRFHYTRDFLVASMAAFATAGVTLLYYEQRQAEHLREVQIRSTQHVRQMQEALVDRVEESSRRDLIAINEQGNLNIGRSFVNTLWPSALAPLLAQVERLPGPPCDEARTLPGAPPSACVRARGDRIRALPALQALDRKVHAAMRGTSVFQVKLFDRQGTIVYATEASLIGEQHADSPGWQAALRAGRPMSELSYRDTYSNLHGAAVRRDLISTYLPVVDPATRHTVAAFEVYADVTDFLTTLDATSRGLRQSAQDNEALLAADARMRLDEVQRVARQRNVLLIGLLALLYLVLLLIVRRAHGVIERQAAEAESNRQRILQAEKMTVLGQMVAGVAHQLNTPLAFSRNNVQLTQQAVNHLAAELTPIAPLLRQQGGPELGPALQDMAEARAMLADVMMGMDQMSELVDHLRSFSRQDRAATTEVDLNPSLETVCYIARTVVPPRIAIVSRLQPLPPCDCYVSQLNQVFLNLIMNAAQAIEGQGTVTVSSSHTDGRVCVSVRDTGHGIPPEVRPRLFEPYFTTKTNGQGTGLGLSIARDIVEQHGGFIEVLHPAGGGAEFLVCLPVSQESAP